MKKDLQSQLNITNALKELGSIPVNSSIIKTALSEYDYPNDKIADLALKGYLIRLKKGMYIVSPNLTGMRINNFSIANNLYGPSYVSLESALSYHSLIPEAVHTTTSVTSRLSKEFAPKIGRYIFLKVPKGYYSFGYTTAAESGNSYQIATPEKALCDLIVLKRNFKIQSKKAMLVYLQEDMRIDIDAFSEFDVSIIDKCIMAGVKKNELELLRSIVNDYQ